MSATPVDVTGFWRIAGPGKWFRKDSRFDDSIRLKFEPVHFRAARGEYDAWRGSAEGCLALLILLDQFPRNLWRGSAHAFATDPLARAIARHAIQNDFDQEVEPALRPFFYLPFEHSEDMADQDLSVALMEERLPESPDTLLHARAHREVIRRFGRFPTRNAALGRENTPDEAEYLAADGYGAVVEAMKAQAMH